MSDAAASVLGRSKTQLRSITVKEIHVSTSTIPVLSVLDQVEICWSQYGPSQVAPDPMFVRIEEEACWLEHRPDQDEATREGRRDAFLYAIARGNDVDKVLVEPKVRPRRSRRSLVRLVFRLAGLAPKPFLPRAAARQLNAGIIPDTDLSAFRLTRRQKGQLKALKARRAAAKVSRLATA